MAAEVDAALAAAKAGQRQQATDALLALEKQARLAEDVAATRKVVTALLQVRGCSCWVLQPGGSDAGGAAV